MIFPCLQIFSKQTGLKSQIDHSFKSTTILCFHQIYLKKLLPGTFNRNVTMGEGMEEESRTTASQQLILNRICYCTPYSRRGSRPLLIHSSYKIACAAECTGDAKDSCSAAAGDDRPTLASLGSRRVCLRGLKKHLQV